MTNKKSFTLLEIILALVVASIVAGYAIQTINRNTFFESLTSMQNTLKYIVNKGIIDPIGYARASGGNCSPSYDFTNMNTQRLADCMTWNTSDLIATATTPVTIIGTNLMKNYGQCAVQTQVVAANTRQFDVYVDCSSLSVENKHMTLVEESIKYVFENDLSSIHISTTDDATDLTNSTGDSEDGQIRARFEL